MGYISLAMLAMGIGTLIQSYGRHGIGTGYPLLFHTTILYLPFAVMAAKRGGLDAVAGLTVIAGLVEIMRSRLLLRARGGSSPGEKSGSRQDLC